MIHNRSAILYIYNAPLSLSLAHPVEISNSEVKRWEHWPNNHLGHFNTQYKTFLYSITMIFWSHYHCQILQCDGFLVWVWVFNCAKTTTCTMAQFSFSNTHTHKHTHTKWLILCGKFNWIIRKTHCVSLAWSRHQNKTV